MSGKFNILKLFVFFVFALLLHGYSSDQSSNQEDGKATVDNTAAKTEQQTVPEGSQTAVPQTQRANGTANHTATAAEGNEQQTATRVTATSLAAADTGEAPQYQLECDADGKNCRVNMTHYIG